jgi:hypothetical protein
MALAECGAPRGCKNDVEESEYYDRPWLHNRSGGFSVKRWTCISSIQFIAGAVAAVA